MNVRVRQAAGILLGVGLVLLTGTGIVGLAVEGLTGWALLLHLWAAPLFVAGGVVAAVRWASRCRFDDGESRKLLGAVAVLLGLVLGLISLGSIQGAMSPYFGTVGQERLYAWHRWGSLGLAALLAVAGFTWVRRRRAARRASE